MNKEDAFKHFLENPPPEYDYFMVGSWKHRFSKGVISQKKITELLEKAGYTAQTLERWTLPSQFPEFTIMYIDQDGFGCTRVNARNYAAASDMVRNTNPERKKLTDVTFCSIEQAINKMNDVIKFDNDGI